MEKERNFSHLFDIIYDKFIELCKNSGTPSGTLTFGKFLGHGHDGRVRAWKKGQWPSAEDCWTIEKKLGFNLRWLITGEGEPFEKAEPPQSISPLSEPASIMKKDFSHLFEIIYDTFKKSPLVSKFGTAKLSLAKALNVSQGKMQYWEKGNWPSAEDLEAIHKKMGFSYRWLVTGEGTPFDEAEPPHPSLSVTEPQTVTEPRLQELERENAELNVELRGALKEIRQLNEEKRELEERLKCTPERQDNRLDNPQHATSVRPASGATDCGV